MTISQSPIPGRFAGRVAAITGAASGIGRATAVRFAAEGGAAALLDVSLDGLGATAAEIEHHGGRALACIADVTDAASLADARQRVEVALGVVTIVANVAGFGDPAVGTGIEQVDVEHWNRVLAVNLTGPFLVAKTFLPGMVAQGRGAIVNVSSVAGRSKSVIATAAYSASKAGLLGLTRHLAFDYGPRGIRVNAICPGATDTPMLEAGSAERAESEEEAARRRARSAAHAYFMPIPRVSTPEEQAAAILFLASDDASYINGVSLDVNGGAFMA
jgi:NAD(P)-dependent dehydrogenase (short-subunit alcohol dehydrogenase family)